MNNQITATESNVYRHTYFMRRIVKRTVLVTIVLVTMLFFSFFVIDITLDIGVFSTMEKTINSELRSSLEEYRESFRELYFREFEENVSENVIYAVRGICEEALVRVQTTTEKDNSLDFEFFINHIRMIVKGLVYFIVLLVCLIYSFYVRNNPDVMLSSMGPLSKQTFRDCITEDLERSKVAARMRAEKERRKEAVKMGLNLKKNG